VALDSFLLIAQIAVTLTGFVGITVALRRGRDGRFRRLFLASMLQTTLGAAFFAALPDPLAHLMSLDTMWRVACGSFGLYHLAIITLHVVRQNSLVRMGAVQSMITIASLPVIALKLAVGAGYLIAYAYPIYYLGLIWLLGIGSYTFILILFDEE
jgi:hypothetical protein